MTGYTGSNPPPGYPALSQSQVVAAITQAATQAGVNPNLLIADAQQESGLNPYAVGDGGTSFGLFQLHEGGELDALPGSLQQQKAEAFDPLTNAETAVKSFASAIAGHPTASAGEIAYLAERPAANLQGSYVSAVNANYEALGAGGLGSLTASGAGDIAPGGGWDPLNWPGDVLGGAVGSAGQATANYILSALAKLFHPLFTLVENGALVLFGAILVVIGLVLLAKDTAAEAEPPPSGVGKREGGAAAGAAGAAKVSGTEEAAAAAAG